MAPDTESGYNTETGKMICFLQYVNVGKRERWNGPENIPRQTNGTMEIILYEKKINKQIKFSRPTEYHCDIYKT